MKNIQITMGEIESLNERIHNLQEDLKELECQRAAVVAQKRAKRVKKVIFLTVGALFLIFAFICFVQFMGLASKGEGFVVFCISFTLIFGVCTLACLYSGSSGQQSEKLERLEKGISVKQKVLNEYKQKKKELIIENERKLNDALKEKITPDFFLDDIAEDKECPMCAETVKVKAHVCRYCGYKFE